MPEPITTEQEWVEAVVALHRVECSRPGCTDDAAYRRDAARFWPLVEPLVTRAQDAERRLRAIRDLPDGALTRPVLRALDRGDERTPR